MAKQTYVFLLFLKISENNSYLYSKNCSLFHFVFKNYFQKTMAKQFQKLKKKWFSIFKNKKLFLNHTTKQTRKFF